MITWAFAIVSQLWILVHFADSPFSIGRGQTLLICIPWATRDLSLSFPPQAGPPSSFGIILIWRILHNPSWHSVLLCHATFFVERGRVPLHPAWQWCTRERFPSLLWDRGWQVLSAFQRAEGAAFAEGREGGSGDNQDIPRGFLPYSPISGAVSISHRPKGVSEWPSRLAPWQQPHYTQAFTEKDLETSGWVAFCV